MHLQTLGSISSVLQDFSPMCIVNLQDAYCSSPLKPSPVRAEKKGGWRERPGNGLTGSVETSAPSFPLTDFSVDLALFPLQEWGLEGLLGALAW